MGLISIRESFHCIAFVSKNILLPTFYVLRPHFSNHLQYSCYIESCSIFARLFPHRKVFCICFLSQEQNLELMLVMLNVLFGNSEWFENCYLSFQWQLSHAPKFDNINIFYGVKKIFFVLKLFIISEMYSSYYFNPLMHIVPKWSDTL